MRMAHSARGRCRLRVFAAWTHAGWIVMPGGLTRVAADETCPRAFDAVGRREQGCLGAVRPAGGPFQPARPAAARPVEIKRQGESAPSRAMDNLFWLGRYAERTESLRAHPARGRRAAGRGCRPRRCEVARKLVCPFSQDSEAADEPSRRRATRRS